MAVRWPPTELPGLWVHLGDWRRQPEARFTCRHGCAHEAFGVRDVTHFTAHIDDTHARTCPGPATEMRT
ncbi:hypothetical protein ABZ890_12100 [Streptomyces sp. NPDC046984]|uniref:hypothetical protein n=1 Tax=Streptomyces sp. NPDC046984 TaxID=3155138 RepID=UPI003405C234